MEKNNEKVNIENKPPITSIKALEKELADIGLYRMQDRSVDMVGYIRHRSSEKGWTGGANIDEMYIYQPGENDVHAMDCMLSGKASNKFFSWMSPDGTREILERSNRKVRIIGSVGTKNGIGASTYCAIIIDDFEWALPDRRRK